MDVLGSGSEIPKFEIITLYRRLTSDETSHPALVPIRATVRWCTVFYLQLHWDRAFVRAAGMAYTTLVSFVPMLLLIFGVLSGTGVLQRDQETLERLIFNTVVGDIPGVREFLMPGIIDLDLRTLSLVGVGGLVFIAARLYLMVERAYNDIFGLKMRRKLIYRLLNFYFTITAVPVLFGLFLIGAVDAMGDHIHQWTFLTMEFGLSFVVLLAALKLFPCGKVNWRPAFVGALVSATLLSLSRFGFHYYLLWFKADDPLNVIYGSVGLIPLFLIWLYLVWVVVLFGVEVAYVGQNFGTLWAAEEEQRLSNHRIRKFPNLGTALSVLVALAEIHQEGGDPLPWEEIARVSGMSQRDVPPMLDILSNRGWILETESGWVLGQAASSIQLSEVADAWSVDTAPDSSSQTKGAVKIQQVLREGVKGSLTGNLEDAIQRWA